MRRWNGWGESSVTHQIPRSAYSRLAQWVGESSPTGDVTLESVIHHIPDSRLAHHPMITDDRETRVRHARGQSVPDWVALRSGRIGRVPDGVVFPTSENQVSEILRWALENQVVLIPYGGGTSVVGHINVISDQ